MRKLLPLRCGVGIFATYAIAAAAIFLLQAFPGTGIFLMFVMGVLWIGLLIHVAMVHLTAASLSDLIPRKWIAADSLLRWWVCALSSSPASCEYADCGD
jgi:hypothetical protein